MRNVTGREDLITCGQTNEFAWQTDRCKSHRMAFKVLLQRQGGPFVVLLKLSLCLLFKKNYHNGLLLLKNTATCTVDYATNVCGHIDDPPTLN